MPGSTSVLRRGSGTGCPQRLWVLLLRDLQVAGWAQAWAPCSWVALLQQGLGQMDPEGPANLGHAVILWSC